MSRTRLRKLAREFINERLWLGLDKDHIDRLESILVRVEQAALEMAAYEVIDCNAVDIETRRLMARRIRELAKERAK